MWVGVGFMWKPLKSPCLLVLSLESAADVALLAAVLLPQSLPFPRIRSRFGSMVKWDLVWGGKQPKENREVWDYIYRI